MKKQKSQFQDIIPPEKRSIRNIPLSNHVEASTKPDSSIREKAIVEERDEIIEIKKESSYKWSHSPKREELTFTGNNRVGGLSKFTLWIITFACVLALFLSITYLFTTAVIKVETKKFAVPMPETLNISLTPKEGEVGYSVVSFSETLSESVVATGEKDASTKAEGTIIVYNAFDSNSQKFVEGTRFETSKGLIYKTTKAITVPGKKTVSGKVVPGSVEVNVLAEKPGAEYNIELSDFTIPGLKGDARFDKFYGRSKTNMVGGESGKVAVVEDADMTRVVDSLKEKLNSKLKEKLEKELPENQVLFADLLTLDFKTSSPKLQDGKALIEVTGSIKAYVLDSNTLSRILLAGNIEIKESDTFSIVTSEAHATIADEIEGSPSVNFTGQVNVSYIFPKEEFKEKIAGVGEDQISEISKQYPGISKISTTIKPFWKKTFPKSVDRIDVVEL